MKWFRTAPRPQIAAATAATLALSLTLGACGAATPAHPALQSAPTSAASQGSASGAQPQAPKPTVASQTAPAPAQAPKPTVAPAPTEASKATAEPVTRVPAETSTGSAPGATTPAAPQPAAFTPRQLVAPVTLKGSGAAASLYQRWFEEYKALVKDLTLDYQSAADDQGVKDIAAGTTAVGGADMALTAEQVKQAPDTLTIPVALDAVAVTYNLEGVRELRLSPATLAGIFQGTITKWNDPKILADNAGVPMPDEAIAVVHRSDSSGTTSLFTSYLSSADADWKKAVGAGATVKWPVGKGAEKDDGVETAVKQTKGAIGYVDMAYALAQMPALSVAALKNASGAFVTPSLEAATAAAAAQKQMPADGSIVNPAEGKDAYPISGYTWALVRGTMKDKAQAEALTDFLYWALTDGSPAAEKLRYAPLPKTVQQQAIAELSKVMVDGKPAFTAPAR